MTFKTNLKETGARASYGRLTIKAGTPKSRPACSLSRRRWTRATAAGRIDAERWLEEQDEIGGLRGT